MNAFREIQPTQAVAPLKKIQDSVKKKQEQQQNKKKTNDKQERNDITDHQVDEFI